MTLDKLIEKFINGDKSAFDEIYSKTQKSVYYVALSIVKDKTIAEDIMQTTYLKVLQNITSYEQGTNAAAWIVKIAKNESINYIKCAQKVEFVDERENLELFGTSETDEYGLLIDIAKNNLTDDEFAIMMLVVVSGYKRREIAKMLDMPLPTVTWKYTHAILKMRKYLQGGSGR